MMRSPQALPVKTLSVVLALLMLCTATTFVGTRVVDRQFKLITGSLTLPAALGHPVADVVLPTVTNVVARPHLDPHRRLPVAERSGLPARGSLDQPPRNIRARRLAAARAIPSRAPGNRKGLAAPIATIAR